MDFIVCRLHDRGKSGWWLVVFCVAARQLLTDIPRWPETPMIFPLTAGAVLIWGAIELGVLPGRPADQSARPA